MSGITARVCRRFAPAVSLLCVFVAVTAAPAAAAPVPWQVSQIGSAVKGAAAIPACTTAGGPPACGTFTVTSTGAGIGDTKDAFTFASQPLDGDGVIVARVSVSGGSGAKAGLMFRESDAPGAAHAWLYVSAKGAVALDRRQVADYGTARGAVTTNGTPVWLKLERRVGALVTASTSSDGKTWKVVGVGAVQFKSAIRVGLVASAADASVAATATVSSLSIATPLPPGWQTLDIGTSRPAAVAFQNGAFTLNAIGGDITGAADQLRYTYTAASGDVDVTARLASLTSTDSLAKAGLVIRQSLAANAAHASLFVTAARKVSFERRLNAGAPSASTAGPAATSPGWLKIERRGSVITGLWSADGQLWTVVGREVVSLPGTFYVGVAVTGHGASVPAAAELDNVTIAAPAARVNQKPTIYLTAPVPNAVITAKTTVTLSAEAADADGTIAGVDFYVAGKMVGTDTTAPYSMTWNAANTGTTTVSAAARDNDGGSTTSDTLTMVVTAPPSNNNNNKAPVVMLLTPVAGGSFPALGSVALMAVAADPDGTVASVEYFANGALIGSAKSSPYTALWSAVPSGSYSVTAVARDNAGATTSSVAVVVTVGKVAPGKPAPVDNTPTPSTNVPGVPSTNVPGLKPVKLGFVPSVDESLVWFYRLEIYVAGTVPGVAAPVITQDLGIPAPVKGESVVDIAGALAPLSSRSYIAVITAVGPGGETKSAPSAAFSK